MPGSQSLSCTTPCFTPARLARAVEIERGLEGVGDRLLAVDVLAGGDRLADGGGAAVGGLRVEVDRSSLGSASALSRSVVQGRPPHSFEIASSFGGAAAHQQRPRHDGFAVAERDAALLHDGVERAAQVLVQPHASGDAVHDDADVVNGLLAHAFGFSVHCGWAPAGSAGTSTPARGSVPSSSWRQWATSPAGP